MEAPRLSPRQMIERLIAYDTTSRNSNLALIEDVKTYLEAWGATVELVPNADGSKANLFATLGPDVEDGVVLSGHTDVVPVDGQDWATDPWHVVEKDGRLYGRGTCDMKSFSAIALALVPDFVAAGLKRPLHFALSYDEEVGCVGVHGLIDRLAKRPGFRPRAVLVGEPTDMRVVSAHKGIRSFRTTVTGLEFHSSQTHKGVSAILAAARLVSYLDILGAEMRERGDPTGKFDPPYTSVQIGTIHGGTAVNIVPKTCSFEWEYRPLPDQDADEIIDRFETFAMEEVLARMRTVSEDCTVETVQLANAPGLRVEEGSSAETLAMALAGRNDTEAVAFATEGGLFQEIGLPTVVCGPGSIQQAHKPNEFIELSQVAACENFLRKLIAELSR